MAKRKVPTKRGQKGKVEDWLVPEKLVLLEGWARNGLEQKQIAHNMGIAATTLCVWKNKHPEIAEAIAKGREVSDIIMENALYREGQKGNVAAIIFYLKNRKPKEWRDRPTETAIEEARLLLEVKKTELEMMKLQMEMASLQKQHNFGSAEEISLENLNYEEISLFQQLLHKARLPAGVENEQDKS